MRRPAPDRYITVTTAGEPFRAFVPAPPEHVPVLQVGFNVVGEFAASERGDGGFGSTGKA